MLISFHTCPLSTPGVWDAGGLNVYVLHLAKELGKLGWAVDIYTKDHSGTKKKIVNLKNNVRVIHLKVGERRNVKKDELINLVPEFSLKIKSFIKERSLSYQIIYAHYYLSGLCAEILSYDLAVPFILTFHTLGVLKKIYGSKPNTKRILLEEKVAEASARIIVSTELEKKSLQDYYGVPGSKIVVLPPGVDTNLFHQRSKDESRSRLNLPEEKRIILFVGRIDPIKGLTNLVASVHQLVRLHPDFEENFLVLLVGGQVHSRAFWQQPEVIRVKRMIERKGLSCCVKFLGAKPHRQLIYYYSAADVVVLPSAYESFGLVIMEAMACGRAVLASRVGGLKFLVENEKTGMLFANKNRRQLSQKLWLLLQDSELRKKLGAEAAKAVRQLSWSKQAGLISTLMTDLIG